MDLERLIRHVGGLWQRRSIIDARCQEIAAYLCPERAGFAADGHMLSQREPGREPIYDTTPEEAADMLAAALHSLLTNPAGSWFALDLTGSEHDDKNVTEWLGTVQRLMLDVFSDPASGFSNEVNTFYADLGPFGWSVFYVEDEPNLPIRFAAIAPHECAIGQDAHGRVSTVARRFPLEAGQALERFGAQAISPELRDQAERDPLCPVLFQHVVLPRTHPVIQTVVQGSTHTMPFVSVTYEETTRHAVRVSGYHEMPYMVPRWSRSSGEVYGRGPGWRALPDIRVLNVVARAQMMAAEKQADPPLLVPDDGVVGKIRTYAGGVTYYRGQDGQIQPLPVAADLSSMQSILEGRRASIRTAFLNDRIELAGGPRMTATEVLSRENKQMLVLGPVLGRLQTEFLGPLIERVFGILLRRGTLPDAPPELNGRELRVRYVSPIARAQKQVEASAFSQALGFIAPLVEFDPACADHFDPDAIVRDTQELFGFPAKYLRAPDAVAAVRQMRDSQIQVQDQAQAAGLGQDADTATAPADFLPQTALSPETLQQQEI